jgi:electron transfer flavoprotein beta subunit
MSETTKIIAVLLRLANDPRPPARIATEGARIRTRGIRQIPNHSDLTALEEAMALAAPLKATVVVFGYGDRRMDDLLRLGLSLGASRAVRLGGEGLEWGDAAANARLLGRTLQILDPVLFVTGDRMVDRGDTPAVAVATAQRNLPTVNRVLASALKSNSLEVLRKSDRGGRQRVSTPLPCALLVAGEAREVNYPPLDAVMASLEAKVEVWGLPELGLSEHTIGKASSYLEAGRFVTPRPDPIRVVTPDANLPTFERIISLLSGGIAARAGKMHVGTTDDAVNGLMQVFSSAGLLPEGTS